MKQYKIVLAFALLLLFPLSAAAQESTDQAVADSAVASEPAATEPAATEPAATEPAATEPVAAAPAADPVQYEEVVYEDDSRKDSGFSLLINIGGTYAFKEKVSSGYHEFEASAGGFEGSVDIGYRYKQFGIYLEGEFRYAVATKPTFKIHHPMLGAYGYEYKAIKKGEWDGYAGGIGLMFMGFFPITDLFSISAGAGLLALLGKSMDHKSNQNQCVIKLQVGFNFAIAQNMTIGLTLSEEGWLDTYRSFSPYLTFNLNAF